MRIFLSAQQALRPHAVPAYAFWEYYFRHALAEAGHEVLAAPGVDWAEGLTALADEERAAWQARTWNATVDYLRAEHDRKPVDLFLGYLYPQQIDPAAVRVIRGLGIPAVNFFCDNVREFVVVPDEFRAFDLHWVPEAGAALLYRAAALRFLVAPMPVWIPPALRTLPAVESPGVIFVGSHDLLREDLLGAAAAAGLDFQVYGDGWMPGAGGPVAGQPARRLGNQWSFWRRHGFRGFVMRATYQMRRPRARDWLATRWRPALTSEGAYFAATRESQVVLGINRFPSFRHSFSRPGRYSRLRDIEAPMLGACYLTESAPGLDELFEPGREIETYASPAELVEKARRLQGDPALRRRLRENGQRRALADHTIARSLARIAHELGVA